jgi:hypothetical protein
MKIDIEWQRYGFGHRKGQTPFMKFKSSNYYGIPDLKGYYDKDNLPEEFVCYDKIKGTDPTEKKYCIHFFQFDWMFEGVWNMPIKTLPRIKKINFSLTPEFSSYTEFPKALQIFQTYKNRWCGRFWETEGVKVIPTVLWNDKSTYDFCFEGVPKHSIIAIAVQGVRKDYAKNFVNGFNYMQERLKPLLILCYGRIVEYSKYIDISNVKTYFTQWDLYRRKNNLKIVGNYQT